MLGYFKKKIVYLVSYCARFFKAHLAHIVFLVFAFQVLVAAGALPYFNLVSQYSYYVFTVTWIIAVFLFRKQITSQLILKSIIILFFIGIPISLLGFVNFSDTLGFVIFVLIATGVVKKGIEDWTSISTFFGNNIDPNSGNEKKKRTVR